MISDSSKTIHDPQQDDKFVYTVSELNQDVRTLLERGFPKLWLEGEISNFACPSSGHWYFSLKDSRAQVRCAMFKGKNRSTGFTPDQGDHVLVKARISLYEARGEYQLIIDAMEEAGSGALQREFEALKKKLQSEGLFENAVKKPLPDLPNQIAVVTSPTGAAVRDILSVLKRRFPAVPVLICPVMVQGESAAQQISEAIKTVDESGLCDVIIVARGGGSLEDLWSFNEEIVARSIFHCQTPVISAVGHEIDFTIADFVADVRAATPSAAAELVVPDANEIIEQLEKRQKQIMQLMRNKVNEEQRIFESLSKRLKHPARQLSEFSQQLDELEMRLVTALKHRLNYKQNDLKTLTNRLLFQNPQTEIINTRKHLVFLRKSLNSTIKFNLHKKKSELESAAGNLNIVSPLATLNRGYAIVSQPEDQQIVRSYSDVKPNDEIEVRIANGQLNCTVNKTRKN